MSNKSEIDMTMSSGNVFADMGLPNPEECLAKAELAYQINKLIKAKKLSQKNAAGLLGIDQPKISALSRGRLSGFSIERLFKFLTILDQDIEIRIKPHKANTGNKTSHSIQHIFVRYAET